MSLGRGGQGGFERRIEVCENLKKNGGGRGVRWGVVMVGGGSGWM